MISDEATSGGGEGSPSVGQDDPRRERVMEDEQRRQDDGIGVPPEANPHAEVNKRDDKRPVKATKSEAMSAPSHQPWQDREDDRQQLGQTPDGGLGGSGRVQP